MSGVRFTEWHRHVAAGIAAAHPLTPAAPIRAGGNHLAAQNDEPEPVDRGQLTQPAEISEAEWAAADLQHAQHHAARYHQRNDAAALELQLQAWRTHGGM